MDSISDENLFVAIRKIRDEKYLSLKIIIVLHLYVFSDEITIRH